MHGTQYDQTLLDIYALCENYISVEGIHEKKFLSYLESGNIKMDLLDFYYNLLVEFSKKIKDDVRECELKKTYASGSIIPPPENEDLVITQEYLEDLRSYSEHIFSNDTLDANLKIQLSFNLELSSLVAFHYQVKWALEVVKKVRSNDIFFGFLMSGLNDD